MPALFKINDGSPALPVRDDVKHARGCRGDWRCGRGLDEKIAAVVVGPYAGQLGAVGGAGHLVTRADVLPAGGHIEGDDQEAP